MSKLKKKRVILNIVLILIYTMLCGIFLYALNHGGLRLIYLLTALVSGAFLGWLLRWLHINKKLDFTHVIVSWLMVNGTMWTWSVFYLACKGASDIAETLGRYTVVELLGTLMASSIKSCIENLSKNNEWPDRKKVTIVSKSDNDSSNPTI